MVRLATFKEQPGGDLLAGLDTIVNFIVTSALAVIGILAVLAVQGCIGW